jgi:hypothetical protein
MHRGYPPACRLCSAAKQKRGCPLWVISGHLARSCRCLLYPPKADKRHVQAECLRSLKVDHQVSLIWCLHRQFAWLGSLEDSIDVEFAVGLLLALNRKKNCWLAPLADQPTDSAEQKLAACEPLTKTFNSRFLIRNRVPGSQPPWEPP